MSVVTGGCILLAALGIAGATGSARARFKADAMQAAARVVEIVNQPVTHLPRAGEAQIYSPGWFHPGAMKPDFAHVDVRATQELIYAPYEHVTSDLNPTEMFIGRELEFNAMTKYFYVDRTLPKKRLTEAEMLKINGLYRVIAHDQGAVLMIWSAVAGLCALGLGLMIALLAVARRKHGVD